MERFIQLFADTKSRVLIITALVIFSTVIYFVLKRPTVQEVENINISSPSAQETKAPEIDAEILKNALNLYIDKRAEGVDLSDGPCLGKIAEDWVLDIAHRPRTAVDDLPENQCVDFREGRAHHFIELDPDGQLIRSL